MSKQKNLRTINNSLNNVLVPEKPLSTVRPKIIMKNFPHALPQTSTWTYLYSTVCRALI